MTSQFTIKPATRQSIKLLIGLYGKSGSGKTYSSLLLARGIAGPSGRITLIDSESGRGSLFCDIVPGGYSVIEIEPPFSPERYAEAYEVAEANSDIVVIDSLTHEHAGEGGVLDMQEAELNRMAGDDWKKREACKMASWIKPKMSHKKFLQRILRSKVPLICCLRGEEKTHIEKGDNGKSRVITDQFSTPIFDPRFLFELLVNFETVNAGGEGGFVIPVKVSHPTLQPLLPSRNEKVTVKHGEALAQWASAGKISGPQSQPERVRWEDASVLSTEPFSSGKQSGFIIESNKGKCWTDDDDLANTAAQLKQESTLCTLVVSTDKKPKLISIEDYKEEVF